VSDDPFSAMDFLSDNTFQLGENCQIDFDVFPVCLSTGFARLSPRMISHHSTRCVARY
jgi:hypothetical protein